MPGEGRDVWQLLEGIFSTDPGDFYLATVGHQRCKENKKAGVTVKLP